MIDKQVPLRLLIAACVLVIPAAALFGGPVVKEGTWQKPSSGSWQTAANWLGDVPDGEGAVAHFANVDPSQYLFVNLGSTVTLGTLDISAPTQMRFWAGSFAFDADAAGGNTALLQVNAGVENVTLPAIVTTAGEELVTAVAEGATLTLSQAITEAGSITKTGKGELRLPSRSYFWTGGMNITDGTVVASDPYALGSPAVGTTLSGGTLTVTKTIEEPLTLSGGTLLLPDGSSVSLNGALEVTADSVLGFQGDNGALTMPSDLSGSGRLSIVDGTVSLSQANTFAGDLHISQGRLIVNNSQALGQSSGKTIVGPGGTLRLNAPSFGNETVALNGGTLELYYSGNMTLGSTLELLSDNELDANYSGKTVPITGSITGPGGLTLNDGTYELFGDNDFSGPLHVKSTARLAAMSNTALGSTAATTTVDPGATLWVGDGVNLGGGKIAFQGGTLVTKKTTSNWTGTEASISSPIDLGEGTSTVIRNDDLYRLHLYGPITGEGGVRFVGKGDRSYYNTRYIYLHGASSYTGTTRIEQETLQVHVTDPAGLGSPEGSTIVQEGCLFVDVPTAEPFEVLEDGMLILYRSELPYTGQCTLRGGQLFSGGQHENPEGLTTILQQPVMLDGGGYIGQTSTSFYSPMVLRGGITGTGTLRAENDDDLTVEGAVDVLGHVCLRNRSNATFAGSMTQAGDFFVGWPGSTAGGIATWEANVANFDGTTFVTYGSLGVNGDNSVSRLVLDSRHDLRESQMANHPASVNIAENATLTVRDELGFLGGGLYGALRGPAEIVKTSRAPGRIASLGETFDGPVTVYGGVLSVADDTGLGSSIGATTIAASDGAAIFIEKDVRIVEDIYLNNASGFDYAGALYGDRTLSELAGNLYLGDQGSYIGGGLEISGSIHGGALTKTGRSTDPELIITGGDHTYTGPTTVFFGRLVLRDEGRLATTSRIDVCRNYTKLVLDDSGTSSLPDRIADNVPIFLDNSTIQQIGAEGSDSSEVLGSVTLESGTSSLNVLASNASRNTTLTVNSLVRKPGTVVVFEKSADGAEIRLPSVQLKNNLIGNWAVFETDGQADEFATVGPEGVVPYSDLHAYVTDLATAGPGDNVRLDANATMSGDTTVNTLSVAWHNDNGKLDLGGATLNLESGGLLTASALTFTNGQLTAGGDKPGELLFYSGPATSTIEANIVDGPGGSVDFTLCSNWRDIALSGTNTYSGTTTVNRARLQLESRQSLPQGTPLVLNAGDVFVNFSDGSPVEIGQLTLRSGGRIYGNAESPIDAESYLVESGTVEHISGTGPMVKTTEARATISAPEYFGTITIEEGSLEVGALAAPAEPGQGNIIVREKGILNAQSDSIARNIVLDGGILRIRKDVNTSIEVTQPSVIDKTILYRDGRLDGTITGNADLKIDGPFTQYHWDQQFELNSNLNNFAGDLHVTGGKVGIDNNNRNYQGDILVSAFRLTSLQPYALGAGTTRVLPDGTLAVEGTSHSSIELAGGMLRTIKGSVNLTKPLRVTESSRFDTTEDYTWWLIGMINCNAGAVLADGVKLTKYGPGDLILRSDLLLGGDNSIVALDGQAQILGTIVADGPNCRLDMIGNDTFLLDTSIRVPAEKELTLAFNGTNASLDIEGYGKSLSGGGTLHNDIVLARGAMLRPGNSPGTLTDSQNVTLAEDGVYQWEINDATGTAGADPGWDLLLVEGTLGIESTAADPFVIDIVGLNAAGNEGAVVGFNPGSSYRWTIASCGEIEGFNPDRLMIDYSDFIAHNPIDPLGEFSLRNQGGDLVLAYTIPEPCTILMLLTAAAGLALGGMRRYGRCS